MSLYYDAKDSEVRAVFGRRGILVDRKAVEIETVTGMNLAGKTVMYNGKPVPVLRILGEKVARKLQSGEERWWVEVAPEGD